MLTIDPQRWPQSAESLRACALAAAHHRTRERFMAIYEVSQGQSATQVGLATKRNPQTVMEWVHQHNELGPEAMVYQRSARIKVIIVFFLAGSGVSIPKLVLLCGLTLASHLRNKTFGSKASYPEENQQFCYILQP